MSIKACSCDIIFFCLFCFVCLLLCFPELMVLILQALLVSLLKNIGSPLCCKMQIYIQVMFHLNGDII
jgi:hypothetical protein